MARLINTQRLSWGVEYHSQRRSPIRRKLRSLAAYVLFRVQLFGGTIDV